MLTNWLDNPATTSWCKRVPTTALVFLLLAVGAIRADPVQDPTVVAQGGNDVLLLPYSLEILIAERYPDFRVPGPSDVKELWARIRVPGTLPFAALADFNGDSLADIALILLSDSTYKIVIFEKTTMGYATAFEIGNELEPPLDDAPFHQRLIISVIPKGEVFAHGSFQFQAEHDSLMVGIFERGSYIIALKDGAYEDTVFGSSL